MNRIIFTIAADRFADRVYMDSRTRLRFSVSGASGLADVLAVVGCIDQRVDMFDEQVSAASLLAAFERAPQMWKDAERELVVILSGHGDSDGAAQWFCGYTAEPNRPDLRADDLARLILAAQPTRVVMLMDFCHSGGVATGLHEALSRALGEHNVLILSGTTATQLAFEHPALGLGLFTYAIHDALTERSFYTRRLEADAPANANALRSDLKLLFPFAREETEELAYLYTSGRRQSPQLFGTGQLPIVWSGDAQPPPRPPKSRRALTAKVRRTLGWGGLTAFVCCALLYFQMYHLEVGSNGWFELLPGPSWMASIAPQNRDAVDQLPITVGDLNKPTAAWSQSDSDGRVAIITGQVDGLRNNLIDGQEPWLAHILPLLAPQKARIVAFAIGSGRLQAVCAARDPKRDDVRDYEYALVAALLDRSRACGDEFYLTAGPDLSGYRDVQDIGSNLNYSILGLSDQAVQMYFTGYALAYGGSNVPALQKRILEAAVLLVSARAENGAPKDADWSAYMHFLEIVSAQRPLRLDAGEKPLAGVGRCRDHWCATAANLAAYFAYGPAASGMQSAQALMGRLIGAGFDAQATQGDAANAWVLPPLLLLARKGQLSATDFDLMIRYFKWIVPRPMLYFDTLWLPRFARVLKFNPGWKKGLLRCARARDGSRRWCSSFDSDTAATILEAQSRFLDASERQYLITRAGGQMAHNHAIAAYGNDIADLACHARVPSQWIEATGQAINYQASIAAAPARDPLSGATIIEITDDKDARALAAAVLSGQGTDTSLDLLTRYLSNHWDYESLAPVRRALRRLLTARIDEDVDAQRLLRYRGDALARVALIEAIAAGTPGGIMRFALFSRSPVLWKLDAVLAAERQILNFRFELDDICA